MYYVIIHRNFRTDHVVIKVIYRRGKEKLILKYTYCMFERKRATLSKFIRAKDYKNELTSTKRKKEGQNFLLLVFFKTESNKHISNADIFIKRQGKKGHIELYQL